MRSYAKGPPEGFPRKGGPSYPGTRQDAARWARDVLRNQILEGVYGGLAAARPLLPPENTIAAELGISRNAVREALQLLRAEGLITRLQGVGTIITGAKLRQSIDRLEGLAESLAGYELPIHNEVLSMRESAATPFVASKLGIPEGSPTMFIERLRSVGGVPLSLDTSSLRPEAISLLLGADLNEHDVFEVLEHKLGTGLGWAENTIESVAADTGTSQHLQVRPGTPLLLLQRLSYLSDGTPFDVESVRYRGDRFAFVTVTPRSTRQQTS